MIIDKSIKGITIGNTEIQKIMTGGGIIWQKSVDLKQLPIGSKIVDPNTKYYGKPIVWIIADKNHRGYPDNTITLISEKVLCLKAFDAAEPGSDDFSRKNYGNNRYKNSNLSQWLEGNTTTWYSKLGYDDIAPKKANVSYNPYDSEPGFMYNFSNNFKGSLVQTNIKVLRHSLDGGGSEYLNRKIFLPSKTEIGLDTFADEPEGNKLSLFSDNYSRIALPTIQAVENSNYKNKNFQYNLGWYYQLRTPSKTMSSNMHYVRVDGTIADGSANYGGYGVRPLCNIKNDANFFELMK